MSCMSAILVNLLGVTDSNLEQRFFSFSFFSFIFAEDEEPLGISFHKLLLVFLQFLRWHNAAFNKVKSFKMSHSSDFN